MWKRRFPGTPYLRRSNRVGYFMPLCRKPLHPSPADIPSGEPFFIAPVSAVRKHDERCVTYSWLSQRILFGCVYQQLLPDYFATMPLDSGVVIGSFIPSAEIVPGLTFPGDVDVLVIPYEGDELVLSHALAIEIKVIRASFARQGKSPNQFGFSQAGALLEAGFPHVAVGHLIVSDDRSPEDVWRRQMMTKIVDADGACGPFHTVRCDMLPSDLLQRSHGRLKRNRPDPRLGHFSAFPCRSGTWFPEGERAALNPRMRMDVLEGIHAYYQKHGRHFLQTRRHPPADPVVLSDSERALLFEQMAEKMR